jgi:hypothetical protein
MYAVAGGAGDDALLQGVGNGWMGGRRWLVGGHRDEAKQT